jgi:signal transduction histidine kinase
MLWQIVLTWSSIVAIAGTGFAVLYTNRRPVFLYYALFSYALVLWLICQFFVDRSVPSVFWMGLGFIAVEAAAGLFMLFAFSYPDRPALSGKYYIAPLAVLVLLAPFSFSPLMVQVTPGGEYSYGVMYTIQTLALVGLVVLGMGGLIYRYVRYKEMQRGQLALLLTAFISFLAGSYATGVIYVSNDSFQFVRPLSALVMMLVIIYAIVRHRLFDIRATVARSLAYLVSVVVLGTIYGFVVFGLAKLIFDLRISLVAQAVLSGSTGLAALCFPYFKKRFDRISNSLFYRDAYDVQNLFDELNRTLVSSLNLSYLLKNVSAILASNIKSGHVTFALKSEDPAQYRIMGTAQRDYSKEDITRARAMTPKIHESVIVADILDENHAKLKQIMKSNEIAVLVRLAPDVHRNEEGLGYIMLGPKKSGNPYTNQDVRVLDTVANELIIAIQNALHFEEIQKFNLTLQQRVEDATRKLRRTNAKLEALDETKDDFISMASHQLRTPLTSVKGYISMVLDGDAGDISPTQRKMLAQAFISSQRMVFLIADLLNVSRLKTGKFIIERAPVNLAKLVAEEVAPLVETAQARGIKLTYAKPTNFPTLMIDETKTRQVVMNFVDNAIYYTRAGGHIDVQLVDKPSTVELKVVDNGIGVPKAEQHHLFTKFYRARNAQKARPDGTGLGLFMAKKVILGQGGAIIFESHEGKGSVFGFTFAKSRLQVAENPVDNSSTPVKQPLTPSKKLTQKA